MRVAVDARVIVDHPYGIARYARTLLAGLRSHPDVEPIAVLDREPGPALVGLEDLETLVVPRVHPEIFWEQVRLAVALRRAAPDLYHATHNAGVPVLGGSPSVLTVHDLIPWCAPWAPPRLRGRLHYRARVRLALAGAVAVIVPSRHTLGELVERTRVSPSKVVVIPDPPDPRFRPAGPKQREAVAKRFELPVSGESGYFVSVAYPRPHKNVDGLVRAYLGLPESLRQRFPLVLTACDEGHLASVMGRRLAPSERACVRPIGFVDDAELPSLVGAATALVFASLYEGFGLPVVEAMACGTPVLCSDATALPEVADGAALLVDPRSETELRAGMRRLAEEPTLRAELSERGLARAERLRARSVGDETVALYHRVLAR